MVLFGFALLAVFLISLWYTMREAEAPRWLFRLALCAFPLPWLAAELGWFVAEFGRQPWIIDGVLPTFLATSELGIPDLILTIVGFTGLAYLGGIPLYLGGIPLYLACWVLIPEEGSEHSIASSFLRSVQDRSR